MDILCNQKRKKKDLLDIYIDENGNNYPDSGKIDYVAGWYFNAAKYMNGTIVKAAFVSTNSICQGTMASAVWTPLFQRFSVNIIFARKTFIWSSESKIKAAVHCVIVGFECSDTVHDKWIYDGESKKKAKHINQYILDAESIIITPRTSPVCNVPKMASGGKPVEGGNLIFTDDEKNLFISKEPLSIKYFKHFMGSQDYIHGISRWCLWLIDASPNEIKSMPMVVKRIAAVKEFRLSSKKAATRKAAEYPNRFMEVKNTSKNFIVIPEISSERRRYIPIGYLDDSTILSNGLRFIPDAGLYEFGVLESNVHMAWTRVVCGRLKSDFDYSVNIVYNNFPWPSPTPEQKARIEQTAQGILDARAKYPDSSLADLYDPLTMPRDLYQAHIANNKAVMAAYGFGMDMTEPECVAALMKMYQQLTS